MSSATLPFSFTSYLSLGWMTTPPFLHSTGASGLEISQCKTAVPPSSASTFFSSLLNNTGSTVVEKQLHQWQHSEVRKPLVTPPAGLFPLCLKHSLAAGHSWNLLLILQRCPVLLHKGLPEVTGPLKFFTWPYSPFSVWSHPAQHHQSQHWESEPFRLEKAFKIKASH